MQKITKKQFLKRKTWHMLFLLTQDQLEPEQAEKLTMAQVYAQWPHASYYKQYDESAQVRLGLSFKGIRKLIKKYPDIDLNGIRVYYGIS